MRKQVTVRRRRKLSHQLPDPYKHCPVELGRVYVAGIGAVLLALIWICVYRPIQEEAFVSTDPQTHRVAGLGAPRMSALDQTPAEREADKRTGCRGAGAAHTPGPPNQAASRRADSSVLPGHLPGRRTLLC